MCHDPMQSFEWFWILKYDITCSYAGSYFITSNKSYLKDNTFIMLKKFINI